MAYTKTLLVRSPTRNTIKVVASAQTDSTTIFIKSAVSLAATGNLAFALPTSNNDGGTITRTSGSWLTDLSNAAHIGGGGINALGQYVVAIGAGASALNQKEYNIIGITALTITVSKHTPVRVAESGLTVTSSAYYSDLITSGQTIIGTGVANIAKIWVSTVTGSGGIITRNSQTVLTLFGGGGEYGTDNLIAPLTENNTSDVVITWQTGSTTGGSAVLEIVKTDGCSAVDVLYGS